mmetsp:Transcript_32270/g.40016  ORF Transcript_32270/g.40016 Transcript_32270/m.40016 type:complete len:99 (-) Transcript_32270:17-313(-)
MQVGIQKQLQTQMSPIRTEMGSPQKPQLTLAMKEKMEYTVAEIGNFMDPDSIKARTEIPFLKKQAEQSQFDAKKVPSVKSKPVGQRKSKARSKVEGFF